MAQADTANKSDQEKSYAAIQRNLRLAGLAAIAALFGGAIFYHYIESLKWLDAIYFCTITLATIGYGDIVPHTDAGKIFTIFYALTGIGIIATFANLFLKRAVAHREIRRAAKEHKRQRETN